MINILIMQSRPTKNNMIKIMIFSIFIFAIFIPIANLMIRYFPHYSSYVEGNKITQYGFGQGKNRSVIIMLLYFVFEIVLIYIFLSKKYKINNLKLHYSYILINFVGLIIGFMSLKSIMFSRIAWYFSIFSIIYIPYVFGFFKGKQKYVAKVLYVFLMIVPYLVQLSSNINGVLPYRINF